ncbi:unnamed protein product [Prorocentrum cordatum]|uniref:Arsenosugar biosynthesis radical SAM protein ArsS-like C-terminal domain-containing protein n=1 Tax=Prorocentrum cordatum TaxID=2364126 RepID=A0ABN9X4U7_9DINO|nr:unnamed protein product [Polarella glacialis]
MAPNAAPMELGEGSPAAVLGWLGSLRKGLSAGGGAGGAPASDPAGGALGLARAALLVSTSAGLAAALYVLRRRRLGDAAGYEYGSVDIQSMTDAAAKALHGVEQGGKPGARRGPRAPAQEYSSLIPDALQDLEESGGTLAADAMAPAAEVDRRGQALAAVGAPPFRRFLRDRGLGDLTRRTTTCLQLNIGLYCNQACTHCHVESSPLRDEMASFEVVDRCLHLIWEHLSGSDHAGHHRRRPGDEQGLPPPGGGSGPAARGWQAAAHHRQVQPDRAPGARAGGPAGVPGEPPGFRSSVIASLPSYDATQTDRQRGRKVFDRSMKALQMLNARGYGQGGAESETGLLLDLVFNPPGPFLPPKQDLLEAKYRVELQKEHGIQFNRLITIANIPVKRFFDFLRKKGTLEGYMDLLVRNFNPETVPHVMCLETVNVRWDGRIYDCDFNQQLELELRRGGLTVFDVDSLSDPSRGDANQPSLSRDPSWARPRPNRG